MSAKFVVSHLDEQMGPFSEDELKAKWAKGDLLPIDYVYDESKQDWILLAECFAWAKKPTETATPPPLKETSSKKVQPPAPPRATVTEDPKKNLGLGAKVKLVDGLGEFDLASLAPGEVELVLQDNTAVGLKLQTPLKIHVKAAEPHAVEWQIPPKQTVGDEAEITIRVVDRGGQTCTHLEEHFLVRVNGATGQQIPVQVKDGQTVLRLRNTKAEAWTLSIHSSGSRTLVLPAEQALEWQPGPAAKLILDGPQEYVAGRPLKVQVKAVDSFGNLAKTFQGTVVLEVKAS